ncbi:MAG TPA: patatin-like phospholipase family protein, partial [Pseudonocardia sp.]|nr:patatin-like phospholipase family protein [Pseudonocardia sp.]
PPGPHARVARFDGDGAPGQAGWPARIDAAEAGNDVVLLVAEQPADAWARFCLRQADRPLLVVDPARPPLRPPVLPAGVQLVALGTAGLEPWLDLTAATAHHIVEAGRSLDDVARLARRVSGRALGVVLSGGGARGLAHIGVLDELVRAGARIDRIGGTSMGAVIAGLAAAGIHPSDMLEMARRELVPRRLFGDVTWPRHGLIRGGRVRSTLQAVFDGARIEEQRRSMFAISVDLVAAAEVVHRRGPIADAVALSVRIPGLAPPERVGDRLHVDGGVLDNLPIGVMAAEGEGPVIAVDVAEQFDAHPPGAPRDALPPIRETIARSMTIGSWRRSRPDRRLAHTVITPDLHGLGMFDFGRLDELVERGRQAGRDALTRVGGLLRSG